MDMLPLLLKPRIFEQLPGILGGCNQARLLCAQPDPVSWSSHAGNTREWVFAAGLVSATCIFLSLCPVRSLLSPSNAGAAFPTASSLRNSHSRGSAPKQEPQPGATAFPVSL